MYIFIGAAAGFIFGAVLHANMDFTVDQFIQCALVCAILSVAVAIEGREKK